MLYFANIEEFQGQELDQPHRVKSKLTRLNSSMNILFECVYNYVLTKCTHK